MNIANIIINILSLVITCTIGSSIVSLEGISEGGILYKIISYHNDMCIRPNYEQFLSSRFSGKVGELSIYLQQSINLSKIVRGSSIAGMIISLAQSIGKAVIFSQKNKILEKISGIKLPV
jgi:hypothetical protein